MSSVDIWQQDETRVGQQGCPTRIWARRGTRPRKVKQRQFISTYIYGAACAETGASCGLVMPEVNTQSMQLFLDELSSIISMGRHAALIIDNAGWHTSHELQVPNNITLIRLPPYSPELNAMEQVWAWIKDRFLSNRCYKDYKDIVVKKDAMKSNIDKSFHVYYSQQLLLKLRYIFYNHSVFLHLWGMLIQLHIPIQNY